ncbi:MAG: hypothetical protein E1N59_3302 [Puniceicoccaceae bacterium 5H]|nr:MAG: hypothetical protein E1N59_3302 [Puniceicoccaceae bacterium 5H]
MKLPLLTLSTLLSLCTLLSADITFDFESDAQGWTTDAGASVTQSTAFASEGTGSLAITTGTSDSADQWVWVAKVTASADNDPMGLYAALQAAYAGDPSQYVLNFDVILDSSGIVGQPTYLAVNVATNSNTGNFEQLGGVASWDSAALDPLPSAQVSNVSVALSSITEDTLGYDGTETSYTLSIGISGNFDNATLYIDNVVLETPGSSGDDMWADWPTYMDGDNLYVDTGDFMGVLYLNEGDTVYSFDLGAWIYLPEAMVNSQGSWMWRWRDGQ